MQTSLELCFCAYLNLKYAQYDGSICSLINIFYAVVFAVLIFAFPIFTIIFYRIRFKSFKKIEIINEDKEDEHLHSNLISFKRDNMFWRERFEELVELLESKEPQQLIKKLLKAINEEEKSYKLEDTSEM